MGIASRKSQRSLTFKNLNVVSKNPQNHLDFQMTFFILFFMAQLMKDHQQLIGFCDSYSNDLNKIESDIHTYMELTFTEEFVNNIFQFQIKLIAENERIPGNRTNNNRSGRG